MLNLGRTVGSPVCPRNTTACFSTNSPVPLDDVVLEGRLIPLGLSRPGLPGPPCLAPADLGGQLFHVLVEDVGRVADDQVHRAPGQVCPAPFCRQRRGHTVGTNPLGGKGW